MGYFISLWGKKVVAYVDENRVIIEPVTATHIERCLSVYNLRVNMGIDEEVTAGGRTLSGYKVEAAGENSEGNIVKAIQICLRLLGIESEVEPVGKVYELRMSKEEIGETEENLNKVKQGETHEEEVGFEPA